MSFDPKEQSSGSDTPEDNHDFIDPPEDAPRAPKSPDPSDPDTTDILRGVAVAAHNYSNLRHEYLTEFLGAPKLVPAPPKVYRDDDNKPPYTRRLSNRHPANDRSYVPCFAKDYARIVHSQSFRKLQGKTQLIPSGENYFFRTRLSHSLEVAEIATRIARRIKAVVPYFKANEKALDLDLVASTALLHDIGHPPFGHSGEEGLNEAMAKLGGFEGNAQTLRLVTTLENRLGRGGEVQEVYDHPRGLNLTVGTLASIIKYDQVLKLEQPKDDGTVPVAKGYYQSEAGIVERIKSILGAPDVPLYTLECQIMDIADDIAYSAYDLEDSMEAGIVTPFDFISVDDEILEKITEDVRRQFSKRGDGRVITPLVVLEQLSKVFGIILTDADAQNPYNLCDWTHRAVFVGRSHNEAMLHAHNPLIRRQFLETLIEGHINAITVKEVDEERPFLSRLTIDPDRLITLECMKAFTYRKVITSQKLQIPHYRGKQVVKFLFATLKDNRRLLPVGTRRQYDLHESDPDGQARIVCDYIASLTDHEAMRLYHRLDGGRNTSVFDYYS